MKQPNKPHNQSGWIERFKKQYFLEEPSNDNEVIKIATGNGPFAYRNADTEDVISFIKQIIQEEKSKAYDRGVSIGYVKGRTDILKLQTK